MRNIIIRLISEREHAMRIPLCSRSGDILEPSLLSQVCILCIICQSILPSFYTRIYIKCTSFKNHPTKPLTFPSGFSKQTTFPKPFFITTSNIPSSPPPTSPLSSNTSNSPRIGVSLASCGGVTAFQPIE